MFWRDHLQDVDFSENALREVPLALFQLEASLPSSAFIFPTEGTPRIVLSAGGLVLQCSGVPPCSAHLAISSALASPHCKGSNLGPRAAGLVPCLG